MKLNTKDLNFYFLTTGKDEKKSNHMKDILKKYNLTEINPPLGIGKQKSGSIGHFQMIEQGLKNQDITKPFQPFIILEDDVSFYQDLPAIIDIPDNADMVYVGISACALGYNKSWWSHKDILYADDIDDTYVRIYNMLSTHAIMITNFTGASVYKKCMMENYNNNGRGWDIPLVKEQPNYNVYAFKKPIFYQDIKYGGSEKYTKIYLDNGKIEFCGKHDKDISCIYLPNVKPV
jgi:hypothetical protein